MDRKLYTIADLTADLGDTIRGRHHQAHDLYSPAQSRLFERLYAYPQKMQDITRPIAEAFAEDWAQVVLGGDIGGALLAQHVAYHLGGIYSDEVLSLFAEKTPMGNTYRLKYGQKAFLEEEEADKKPAPGDKRPPSAKAAAPQLTVGKKRILIVEAIATRNSAVPGLIRRVQELKHELVGVAILCNPDNFTPETLGRARFWNAGVFAPATKVAA